MARGTGFPNQGTNRMKITEVKVFPVKEEKLRAFVSIVLDDCFIVNDIKIIQGRESLFISMPSRRKKNGEFKDVAHPLNNATRRWIEGTIIDEYHAVVEGPPRARRGERGGSSTTDVPGSDDHQERSLDEVQEHHLSDSFWKVG